jgi:hypothetical protein
MKSSMNIEQIFYENLSNSKLKIVGNLGTLLYLLKSPYWVGFNEGHLEIFRLKSQEIEFWIDFVIENLIKLQKMILEGKT